MIRGRPADRAGVNSAPLRTEASSVRVEWTNGHTILVTVRGRLDGSAATLLTEGVRTAVDRLATSVHLDLGRAIGVDPVGAAAVLRCHRMAQEAGGGLRVTAVSEPARQGLELAGLRTLIG